MIEVDQLSPQTTATLTIRKGDCQRSVTIQTLPDSFPTVQFTGHSRSEGDFYGDLMNDDGDSYILKWIMTDSCCITTADSIIRAARS